MLCGAQIRRDILGVHFEKSCPSRLSVTKKVLIVKKCQRIRKIGYFLPIRVVSNGTFLFLEQCGYSLDRCPRFLHAHLSLLHSNTRPQTLKTHHPEQQLCPSAIDRDSHRPGASLGRCVAQTNVAQPLRITDDTYIIHV